MELIVKEVNFPEVIEFNFEEIKQEVAEKVERYANVIYTEDQIKDAKSDRAHLRKFVDALETKRKEIKKQCLAPYETFEKQMKEIIGIVNEPIAMIDRQVKEYEEIQKAEKREAIESYWISLSEDGKIPEGIRFDQIFNEKWLNASVNIKNACAEINARLDQIEKDLATLAEMSEFAFEAAEVYRNTLDINKAITEGKRLLEMQKRKAEAEAAKAEAPAPTPTPAPVTYEEKPTPPTAKTWVAFQALLSVDDAKALKALFAERGIQYKSI